jgi:rhomboid protease GluP
MIEPRDYEFLRAFWTRRAVIAYSLFALNFIVFALMSLAGGSESQETLYAFGAKFNDAINNGEIWRFVTPIFIHIGLLHLAFNSYALWIIGPQVEKLYGGPRFLLLYILTGIAGVAASYSYHPSIPSAGASGAIFGLFGVLLVFSFKYRKVVPTFFSQALGKGILLTVGINLVIGFMIPMVDVSAHMGGLIAGGLLAFAIPFARPGETERPVFKVIQSLLVLLIAASFFQVATHYAGPGLSLTNLGRGLVGGGSGSSVKGFVDAINQAETAFEDSEKVLGSGDLRTLPDVNEELGRAIDSMKKVPSLNSRADKLAAEFLDVLQKQYDYVQEVERVGRTRSDFIGTSPQSSRYRRLKQRIEQWSESEGANYGIVNTK